jgi:hypothetical protein
MYRIKLCKWPNTSLYLNVLKPYEAILHFILNNADANFCIRHVRPNMRCDDTPTDLDIGIATPLMAHHDCINHGKAHIFRTIVSQAALSPSARPLYKFYKFM